MKKTLFLFCLLFLSLVGCRRAEVITVLNQNLNGEIREDNILLVKEPFTPSVTHVESTKYCATGNLQNYRLNKNSLLQGVANGDLCLTKQDGWKYGAAGSTPLEQAAAFVGASGRLAQGLNTEGTKINNYNGGSANANAQGGNGGSAGASLGAKFINQNNNQNNQCVDGDTTNTGTISP